MKRQKKAGFGPTFTWERRNRAKDLQGNASLLRGCLPVRYRTNFHKSHEISADIQDTKPKTITILFSLQPYFRLK